MRRLSILCLLLLGAAVAVMAESEMAMEYAADEPLLAQGTWRHEPVDRSLLQHEHTAEVADGPRGLETEGATSAHYATLAHDNTWEVSRRYCADHGAELCSKKQICPGGKPIGADEIKNGVTAFAPISGSDDWVQVSGGSKCKVVRNAKWGKEAKTMKEQNAKWAHWSKSYVPCCNKDGVMKSYLVADSSLVDPSMEAKLSAAHKTASKALSALKKLKGEMKKMKDEFIVMSKGAASKKTVAQLKEALQMRGNSALVRTVRDNARVAKNALNKATKHGMCCGSTAVSRTRWVQYSAMGIYLDVSIAKCKFKRVPVVVSSLGGATSHWVTKGTSQHYYLKPGSFRVYIQWTTRLTPAIANQYGWHLRWCAQDPQ